MQQAAADREMLYSVAKARVADETYDISLMSSTTHWLSSRHISCMLLQPGSGHKRRALGLRQVKCQIRQPTLFLHDSAVLQFTAQRGQTAQACTEPFFQSSGDEGSALDCVQLYARFGTSPRRPWP